MGVLVTQTACDLQPKITDLPDTVGDFISARYPTLLADPNEYPEIYNSAASDYGVYAAPQLYGTEIPEDYVMYASVDDYIVPPQMSEYGTEPQVDAGPEIVANVSEEITDDFLIVPMYGGGTKKQAEVKEQELAASIKKQAEAEKYRIEQNAQAELFKRQKEAEARKYEETQRAEAEKVKAEALKYTKEQEAAGIAAIGRAEAEAIREKGIAEAEALEKKADAMAKYGRAAILEMVVNKLPEMAGAIAKPLESIDKVTIIDGGGAGTGVESMGGYVPAVLAKTIESIKETTGIDINEIVKADTYDAKVNKNLNVTGLEGQDVNLVMGETAREAAASVTE